MRSYYVHRIAPGETAPPSPSRSRYSRFWQISTSSLPTYLVTTHDEGWGAPTRIRARNRIQALDKFLNA